MKFNEIYKKTLTSLLVVANFVLIPTSLSGCATKDNEKIVEVNDNTIGHDDISPLFNFGLDSEDFVVLDIGDHDSIGVNFQGRKLSYCNDKDIALGIIISSDANNEASIYDDVEYVKGILSKYDVSFPVYLDIDNIVMNDNLNNEMKTKLIKNFLEKCSSNNIYVGIKGSDTNLCRVKQYCGITDYDAYLVMDSENIRYDGVYNVVKDLDGNISSKSNLAEIITNRELNNPDNFISDGAYELKEGEDILDVAYQTSMSVNELLEFNGISKEDIEPGKVLRIPSSVSVDNISISSNEDFGITVTYDPVDTPLRGADLSYAQGKDSDWELLKENFDFLILKCNQGEALDSCFEYNVRNCNLYNIPVGVYCYNHYDKSNCTDDKEFSINQENQANFVLTNLKNKRIDYPVYLDIESPGDEDIRNLLSPEQVNIMLNNWIDKMLSSGYIPGVYCNQDVLTYLKECVNYDLSDKFEIWVAGGPQYTGEKIDIPLEEVKYPETLVEKLPDVSVFQATDSAIGTGAGNHLGHLDINYTDVDYTKKRFSVNENINFEIKTFNRIDYIELATKIGIGLVGIGAIGTAGVVLLLKKIKKDQEKKKETKRQI